MDSKDIDLSFLGNCPICSKQYQRHKTTVLEKNEEVITLHIDCANCMSSILLTVNSGLKGLVTTIGVPTDLAKKDIPRLKKSSKITVDDVLELHTHLEKRKK